MEHDDNHTEPEESLRPFRRSFLKATGVLVGALGLGSVAGGQASASVADGNYTIQNVNSDKVADVDGISDDPGANVIQWTNWDDPGNQTFQFESLSDGSYRITAQHSGHVLMAEGGEYGNLVQAAWDGNDLQRWTVEDVDAEGYRIENVGCGHVLDVEGASTEEGANILIYRWHGGSNQRWYLEPEDDGDDGDDRTVENGVYALENVNSDKLADVSGVSEEPGANVHQWENWNDPGNQKWYAEHLGNGEYRLTAQHSDLVMTVESGDTDSAVQQPWDGSDTQRWRIEPTDEEGYKIENVRWGTVLDVYYTRTTNGADIHLWEYHGGPSQRWRFNPVDGDDPQPPTANFDATPDSPAAGQSVEFDAGASSDPDGSIESYSWEFGDGESAQGAVVSHAYDSGGTYEVSLTVTDDDGQSDTASTSLTVSDAGERVFENPYAGVDWGSVTHRKADFHTHTEERPNNHAQDPADVTVDEYSERGYAALAITEHDYMTWPWEDFGRDPADLGMVAIQGCECSSHHHMNSWFNGYDGVHSNIHDSLQAVGANGGLAQLNHPGRYDNDPAWYIDLFESYDQMLGIEVQNRDRHDDRALWDEVLHAVLPDRQVWGFSNDDSHGTPQIGHTANVLLVESLDSQSVRSAMENGHFYSWVNGDRYEDPAASIDYISVEGTRIDLDVSGATAVRWKTYDPGAGDSTVVSEGTTCYLSELPSDARFVRAEVDGSNGALLQTQAFPVIGDDGGGGGDDPGDTYTFFGAADPQYKEDRVEGNRKAVEEMNAVVGEQMPDAVGGGTVEEPEAVIVAGDLTESASQDEYDDYKEHFGVGTDGILDHQVYDAAGNHDGGPDSLVRQDIVDRNPHRDGIASVSESGEHYSWNWGPIHFLQLGLYAGNTLDDTDGPGEDSLNDPTGARDFLERSLEEHVGDSGRPVIIVQHYAFDGWGLDWWNQEAQDKFYDIISDYNVILMLGGHSHVQRFDEWRDIPYLILDDTGADGAGYWFVMQVEGDTLRLARRGDGQWDGITEELTFDTGTYEVDSTAEQETTESFRSSAQHATGDD